MKNKAISPVIAGIIVAAVLMLFALLINVMGQTGNSSFGWLTYLVIIVALVLLITQYGKANNNTKTFGELFGYGFKATAIYTLIYVVFLDILVSMMPEIKQKALEAVRTQMEKQNRSDTEVDNAVAMADKYFRIALIGGTIFGMVLCGVIGSLIGAGVTKKKPANPLDQLDV
jgi:hypothetical protein